MFIKWMSIFCITFLVFSAKGDDYTEELIDIFGLQALEIPSLRLIHNGNKSYYIGDVFKGNVLHALQFCRYHGMQLLSIESQEENDFLEQTLIELGIVNEYFHTSGNRIPSNNWVWLTTGKALKYANWNPGEPNNVVKEEQCIVVNTVNKQMKWYDAVCWNGYFFICEVTWSKTNDKLLQLLKNKTDCHKTKPVTDLKSGVEIVH